MALQTSYPDLRYPMVHNEAYLTLLLVLLREYTTGPRIGYARLVIARNNIVVVSIAGSDYVIYLGHTSKP